jgi:UPF0716 protein FxsA
MFYRLLLVFTLIPLIELYILIKIGKYLGTLNVIALVIITGILGASFARQQGAGVLSKIRESIHQGELPGIELLHGLMILVGGILLITPGFMTDIIGLTLLIPFTRHFYTNQTLKYIKKRLQSHGFNPSPDEKRGNFHSDHLKDGNNKKTVE